MNVWRMLEHLETEKIVRNAWRKPMLDVKREKTYHLKINVCLNTWTSFFDNKQVNLILNY